MTDKMPIRLITRGEGDYVQEISPESFVRLEVDLGMRQTLWVEGPEPVWFLDNQPASRILIMGGPGGRAIFRGDTGNSILAAALPDLAHIVKYPDIFAAELASLGVKPA